MSLKTRRVFLSNTLKTTAKIAVANTVIYAIGTSVKEFDGSLVAGAKTCSWELQFTCLDSPGIGDRMTGWEDYDNQPCAPGDNRRTVCAGAGDYCGRLPKCNSYKCICY